MKISLQSTRHRPVIVTGGVGFIGSHLVRRLLKSCDCGVITVDKLTYAGRRSRLADCEGHQRHTFCSIDIADRAAVRDLFRKHRPAGIFNLAAESHVDRSIDRADDFLHTNVTGTFSLLEEARAYWQTLPESERTGFRFLHVSTDEVYGSLGSEGRFTEESPYRPNSPYAATKAAADHLARAWHRTYGLPVVVTNCSNNYGPFQYPEKLIPVVISRALKGEAIPVYGRGENVRDWLHVDDHVAALILVLEKGRPGETYNVGASCEVRNIDLVERICGILDKVAPRSGGDLYSTLIEFVTDRPGHDLRYAIDSSRIRRELGWRPQTAFEKGLEATVLWYIQNPEWLYVKGLTEEYPAVSGQTEGGPAE